MEYYLDEAKKYYTNESNSTTDAKQVAKAKQVFGDSFPEEMEARENYFASLKEKVTEVISHRFSSESSSVEEQTQHTLDKEPTRS